MDHMFVCISCLKDPGLIDFFEFEYNTALSAEAHIIGTCNFCHKENVPLIRANTVVNHIKLFIKEGYSSYNDRYTNSGYPLTQLFNDYRDGVKIVTEEFDAHIFSELSKDSQLYQIGDDFTLLSRLAISEWSWKCFCECIKANKKVPSNKFNPFPKYDSPDVFLESRLPTYLTRCDCIHPEKKGAIIYRGRKTNYVLPEPLPFDQITSPALKYIKGQNRFSSDKVSMFYGAADEETAKKEVDYQNEPHLYIGMFSLLHEIRILDLSQIQPPNGLFDQYWQGEYYIMQFMNSFIEEIRKPAEDQTIDYKPTQAISDYIRNNELYGQKVDGIKYKSSKTGEICYVFFWDSKESIKHLELKKTTHARK